MTSKTRTTSSRSTPRKKSAQSRTKGKAKAEPAVSRTRCPEGMTVEQWQRALRRQFGARQKFEITKLDGDSWSTDFRVLNPHSGGVYHLTIRGDAPGMNRCTCGDFVTNELGTCKHIEAVLAKHPRAGRTPARKGTKAAPDYSEIWLAYGAQRGLRLRLSHQAPDSLRRAALQAAQAVSADGGALSVIPISLSETAQLEELQACARQAGHRLRVSADAREFVARAAVDAQWRRRLQQLMPGGPDDPAFDTLLKLSLLPYQREGAWFAARSGRALIADEMGLGKTAQAIATLKIWQRWADVQRALIVCPTSLKHQWAQELRRFAGIEALVIEGSPQERARLYAAPVACKIVSYESLTRDEAVAATWAPQVLVVDEAQRVKNWDTLAARCLKRFDTRFALVLTGTPLENRLEELLSVVQLVDRHRLGPTWRFLDEHQLRDESGRVVGYRQLDRISATLAPIMIRRRKSDVLLQLPERRDANVFLPLTKRQAEWHAEFADQVARIVQRWRRMGFLSDADQKRMHAALSSMRRVCNSTYLLDAETDEGLKVPELLEWLDERLADDESKVVVFSAWLGSHELIRRGLEERGIGYVFFHGSIDARKLAKLVQRFHDEPDCRVFLATDAGSVGLNLQNAAALIVNLDLPWNPAVLEQRIARVFRMGQTRRVEVVNFIAEDSIEHRILGLIGFKQALFAGALDGGESAVALEGGKLGKFMASVQAVLKPDPAQANDAPDLDEASTSPMQSEAAAEEAPVDADRYQTTAPASEPLAPDLPDVATFGLPEPAASVDRPPAGAATRLETEPESPPTLQPSPTAATTNPDAAAVALVQGLAPLLQAAGQWLSGVSSRLADPAGKSAIVHDPVSGQPRLQIPLPSPALLRQLADLSESLSAFNRPEQD